MAGTVINTQTLVDTTRRTLIKVVGTNGGTDANTLLIDVSSLSGALNTSNKIMTSGVNKKSVYRTTIKRIHGQGTFLNNGHINLQWQGAANTIIATLGGGYVDYNFDSEGLTGAIGIPDPANSTGNIVFSSGALASGDAFTFFIDLKKDGRDYDQGQTRDPAAFNAYGFEGQLK